MGESELDVAGSRSGAGADRHLEHRRPLASTPVVLPRDSHHTSIDNPTTTDSPTTRLGNVVARPIFVDDSGRRRRWLHVVAYVVTGLCAVYVAVAGVSLARGGAAPLLEDVLPEDVLAPASSTGSELAEPTARPTTPAVKPSPTHRAGQSAASGRAATTTVKPTTASRPRSFVASDSSTGGQAAGAPRTTARTSPAPIERSDAGGEVAAAGSGGGGDRSVEAAGAPHAAQDAGVDGTAER